jgi:hypothetical protein
MTTLETSIDEGVLRVLRDLGARTAGSRIELSQLLKAWGEARLRNDDLLACLHRLKLTGRVRLDRVAHAFFIALLPAGERWLAQMPEDVTGLLFLAGTTAMQGGIPRREDIFSPGGRHRRKTDPRPRPQLPEIEAPGAG